jgi:hypothetical protein
MLRSQSLGQILYSIYKLPVGFYQGFYIPHQHIRPSAKPLLGINTIINPQAHVALNDFKHKNDSLSVVCELWTRLDFLEI